MNESRQPVKNSSKASPERQQNSRRIVELVARLTYHYWTADDHPAVREAQAEDWIEDLAEFAPEVVEAACQDWRQSNRKQPIPFDIRSLAIAEHRRRHPEPEPVYVRPPPLRERTPEEVAYVEQRVAGIVHHLRLTNDSD